jgi:hypothetical protein
MPHRTKESDPMFDKRIHTGIVVSTVFALANVIAAMVA